MSLFRCSKCGCIENTALGFWWTREDKYLWPADTSEDGLCSEHGPQFYRDGTPSEFGKWHGKFEQKSAVGMLVDNEDFLWSSADQLPRQKRIVGKVGEDGKVVPL